MTAAVGLASRPERSRSASTRAWLTRSNRPVVAPCRKPAIDGAPGRKVGRQQSPRAARAHDVEDGIDDLAHRPGAGSPLVAGRRQQWLQKSPFDVGQIARIAQVRSAMMPTGDRGPHRTFQAGFSNPLESALPRSLNQFRDSLLVLTHDGAASASMRGALSGLLRE